MSETPGNPKTTDQRFTGCLDRAGGHELAGNNHAAVRELTLAKRYTNDHGERMFINQWIDRLEGDHP